MAKAAFNKTFKVSAKGILHIEGTTVSCENPDNGELVNLSDLFEGFEDRTVSITINYDEDY